MFSVWFLPFVSANLTSRRKRTSGNDGKEDKVLCRYLCGGFDRRMFFRAGWSVAGPR